MGSADIVELDCVEPKYELSSSLQFDPANYRAKFAGWR